jgi:hypothetical protein
MVQALPGVLLESDEATIVFLTVLNEQQVASNKFILKEIDGSCLMASGF